MKTGTRLLPRVRDEKNRFLLVPHPPTLFSFLFLYTTHRFVSTRPLWHSTYSQSILTHPRCPCACIGRSRRQFEGSPTVERARPEGGDPLLSPIGSVGQMVLKTPPSTQPSSKYFQLDGTTFTLPFQCACFAYFTLFLCDTLISSLINGGFVFKTSVAPVDIPNLVWNIEKKKGVITYEI